VAFESRATNLVAGDTNGHSDVFVHDVQDRRTTRVSVSSTGQQANNGVSIVRISADGNVVAFRSAASNLDSADTNGQPDVFVHEMDTGKTAVVSLTNLTGVVGNNDSGGGNGGGIALSADGRLVAFQSYASNMVSDDSNGKLDIFVRNRREATTTRLSVGIGSEADDPSYDPTISADGRFVAFVSEATNLVSTPGVAGCPGAFVRDTLLNTTTRVSVNSVGTSACAGRARISANGNFVSFESAATNLVAGDNNGIGDVFVHDLQAHVTTLVSVNSAGVQGNGDSTSGSAISEDGRFVAFPSSATNLVAGDTNGTVDVFVRDRGVTEP
jgi:Tol biopolymer transport system component